MKFSHFIFFLLSGISVVMGQNKESPGEVVITTGGGKTRVHTDEKGILHVDVSNKDARKFSANGLVHYSDFGARGDGKTDDMDAISATHAFANQYQLLVKADDGATYYFGGNNRIAVVQTDTDFGNAVFIIDDTDVKNQYAAIFEVASEQKGFSIEGVASLKRNQEKINVSLPGTCLVSVTNPLVTQYIRFGPNQNNGSPQTDIFLVDKDGNVDSNTPIIWDFDQISSITAVPVDTGTLNIIGGRFITIANDEDSGTDYFYRNIAIKRSNVIVSGMEHRIRSEGEQGAPYAGFISISDCNNVTVKNTLFTGHKTYRTMGSAGQPVSKGTYDILVTRALNISFINCTQTNDINDHTYWGIMGSNYCKNLLYDSCTFSRFDAHKGVANAAIRNSTLGYMGINAIGSGTLTVENSTILGRNLVNLRSDYGSTWQGEFIIRNCVFVPNNGKPGNVVLINGHNSGQHDFGYNCYMPERITIENLYINDTRHPKEYAGPTIFANFNPQFTDETFREKFPYVKTQKVVLINVTTASGKPFRVSENPFMFRDVKIERR